MAVTLEDLAVKIAETNALGRENKHRIEKLEDWKAALDKIDAAIEVMGVEQQHQTEAMHELKEDVSNLDKKVETIEQKPAKRWESLVATVIGAIAGAFVTWVIAGMPGLK